MTRCERCGRQATCRHLRIDFGDGFGQSNDTCAICERAIREYIARYRYRLVPAPRPGQGPPSSSLAGPGRRDAHLPEAAEQQAGAGLGGPAPRRKEAYGR